MTLELDTATEVATPAEEVEEETSENVEPETSDTLTSEPETTGEAADIETETPQGELPPAQEEQEPVLYAGKYKDIPAFEKGYKELNAQLTKQQEQINAYLRAEQERQAKAHQQALEQAKYRGFETVEDAQIAQLADEAEFNFYWQNIRNLPPEYAKEAEKALKDYQETYNSGYLNEAKRYFASHYIEQAALIKNARETQLRQALTDYQRQQHSQQEQALANQIRESHAEFLADIQQNSAKSAFLKLACAANAIKSPEDMQVFASEYTNLEKAIREQAIKEYEAQKVIEAEKNKAVIDAGVASIVTAGGLKESYTAEEIGKMSMQEYNALCDKYGETEITRRIK